MPSPGAPGSPRLSVEDSYLELLADTLEGLDLPARGQFLQRYFRTITRLDLRESQCLQLWDDMLSRRREFSDQLGRPISLKTALMDVLSSAGLFRVPILIEYDDLKRLQLNAITDPLTSLYNRRLFGENLERELNRARRYSHPLALVILDMHRFKEVNDKHGHPRGDEVLRIAATTLRKTLRTSDSAFRIGGDEFALLLPQTDSAQAVSLSRRVEAAFQECLKPLQLSISVSIDHGVATYPQDGDQADDLIRVADERLYQLKHGNHKQGPVSSEPAVSPKSFSSVPPAEPTHNAAPTPKPIPFDSKRPNEKRENSFESAASAAATGLSSTPAKPKAPESYAVQRKAERVSMVGTNAYAVLGEAGSRRARVLDLGFGGVALELDSNEELPENVLAVLHVPILPPVRVNLRTVWSRKFSEGSVRVGCCFVA